MSNLDLIKLAFLISGMLLAFLGVLVYLLVIPLLREVGKKEIDILEKKKEINELPKKILKKIRNSLVNQSQFEKMVKKDQKPLLQELDILQTKRQFLLDKLPFLSFFKK